MSTPDQSPLGKSVAWPERRDASLLFPIDRTEARRALGIGETLPFIGFDLWTAYEAAWLDTRGKPCVGIATLQVPCDTPRLVESKSMKLYLNGYAHERFDSRDAVCEQVARDVSEAAGGEVAVEFVPASARHAIEELEGELLDDLPIAIEGYGAPEPAHLRAGGDGAAETLVSHLFRSNCPVTGQPDWASVQVGYRGPRIDHEGLLRYLVSFRTHHGFHEQCVERLFVEVMERCAPEALSIVARFTRRGGIDINPWRATPGYPAPARTRTARQ